MKTDPIEPYNVILAALLAGVRVTKNTTGELPGKGTVRESGRVNTPLETLKHHVTGAIERGEKVAIVARPRQMLPGELLRYPNHPLQ